MKSTIATTLSIIGVLAAGTAAYAVNVSVLNTPSAAYSTVVDTVAPVNTSATPVALQNVEAQATPVSSNITTYQVGTAGNVVVDVSSGAIVVVSATPNAGYTSEPVRPAENGVVKVHFVSATSRIEFAAQLVAGKVVVNVTNDPIRSAPPVAQNPKYGDDDDHYENEPRKEKHDEDREDHNDKDGDDD